jgi:RNA polymerase sigma-70 factor (ECF subfamily)
MRSPETVEDLKQETFVRVLANLRQQGGLATPESLGAYVSSVCRNVLFEQYRAQARGSGEMHADAGVEKADSAPGVEAGLIVRDQRQQVREVLAELSEQDQKVLRALFYEECDKDELCRRVGVDRDYLRVLVHRAKARFRAGFEGKVEDQ